MRAKSAEEVLAAAEKSGLRNRPNVDGWLLPDDVYSIFAAGKQNPVPVIVGSTADEGTTLVATQVPKSKEAYLAAARTKYGGLADEYLAVYPAETDEDVRGAFLASVRDEWFTWEMRTAGAFHRVPPVVRHTNTSSRTSRRRRRRPTSAPITRPKFCTCSITCRRSTGPSARSIGNWPPTSRPRGCHFAATGDPNGAALPGWAPYDAASQTFIDFGDTIKPGHALLDKQCNFFDKYYAAKRAKP